ncbi:MAG: hypothetical protein M3Y55_04410, partial [Pseudomonadota bacterium]|nr:hypothetical protein [Pseudomonadota bacterium]
GIGRFDPQHWNETNLPQPSGMPLPKRVFVVELVRSITCSASSRRHFWVYTIDLGVDKKKSPRLPT